MESPRARGIDSSKSFTDPRHCDAPILMLYSLVDDRSGVCYPEYRNVYGEDTEAALRFLFNAMSAKSDEEFPFRGIPAMLYMDTGPIAKSQVFQRVMAYQSRHPLLYLEVTSNS
jgi:hypothetical protein